MVVTASSVLLPWERATLPADELNATSIPLRFLSFTTALFLLAGALCMFLTQASLFWFLPCLLIARLAALDLYLRVLPDIYTLPLIIIGLLLNWLTGNGFESFSGLCLSFGVITLQFLLTWAVTHKMATIGGGDLKYLLAIGAIVGLTALPFTLLLAGLLTLPLFPLLKTQQAPFGVGLSVACLIMLFFPEKFLSLLSLLTHFM